MIIIDTRAGSVQFTNKITPSVPGKLNSGDFMFSGKLGSDVVRVGIERKTVREMIASCKGDKRFVGSQLPSMVKDYDQRHLVVEGLWEIRDDVVMLWEYDNKQRKCDWRAQNKGRLPITFSQLYSHIISLTMLGGLHMVHWTKSEGKTARLVEVLYHWYQRDHSSHHAIYLGKSPTMIEPSLKRKVASTLPGIGWELSGRVADNFDSVLQMVNATSEQWQEVDGVGKGKATSIINAIGGHHE